MNSSGTSWAPTVSLAPVAEMSQMMQLTDVAAAEVDLTEIVDLETRTPAEVAKSVFQAEQRHGSPRWVCRAKLFPRY